MTNEEAIKLIDDRMRFGRGKWSEHHRPVIDEYWQAGEMAIKALEQPEIVYCRYCEHADFVKMGVWCCKGGGGLVPPDFFCGHGKKRREVTT